MLMLLSVAAAILMIRPSSIFGRTCEAAVRAFPWRWMAILAVPYAYFGGGDGAHANTLDLVSRWCLPRFGGTATLPRQESVVGFR